MSCCLFWTWRLPDEAASTRPPHPLLTHAAHLSPVLCTAPALALTACECRARDPLLAPPPCTAAHPSEARRQPRAGLAANRLPSSCTPTSSTTQRLCARPAPRSPQPPSAEQRPAQEPALQSLFRSCPVGTGSSSRRPLGTFSEPSRSCPVGRPARRRVRGDACPARRQGGARTSPSRCPRRGGGASLRLQRGHLAVR